MGRATVVLALAPFVGLLACVAVHVVVSRAAPTLSRLHVIVGSFLAGLGVVAAMALALAGSNAARMSAADRWGTAAAWLLTYVALTYCYVFGFFNVGESARRVRLLIELLAVGKRGLTLEEILAAYNARTIVEARLKRLLSSGQIVERGGRYFVGSPLMLSLWKVLVLLKVIVLGARSEFGSRVPTAPSALT